MPAQTVRLSRGSTMMLVVRGVPMGHSMFTPMSSFCQDLPPSRERKPSGRVPAKMVSGLPGFNGHRPHLQVAGGGVDAVPRQAVVLAAEQAEAIGAGQYAVGVVGIGTQGADVALGGNGVANLGPGIAAVGADVEPLANSAHEDGIVTHFHASQIAFRYYLGSAAMIAARGGKFQRKATGLRATAF